MKKPLAILLSTTCASLAVPVLAQDVPPPLPMETITVREAIDPGPRIFVMDQSWSGRGTLQIYGADDLSYKGGMGTGSMAQGQLSADGETAYTISTYMRRYTYGDVEMVLQAFDVDTLTVTMEVLLPPKIAMVGPYDNLLQLTSDEHFALVMNATPAASVTIVDLEAGTVASEVPTPGCWSIYPSASVAMKWTMLCGDGTARTFIMNETGTEVVSQEATPIFDADTDPLFVHVQRGMGNELLFVSYNGNIYRVSDQGDAPELIETFSITDAMEEPWAPGGYALTAYNEANDLLFVVMHDEPYDGSHKDPGDEIWVIDMATDSLLYRMQTEPGIASLAVDNSAMPVLFAFNEEDYTVHRYVVDPAATFGIIFEETAVADVNGASVITVGP